MKNLVNNLAKLDTRLIVVGVVMICAIFFALYKMSGAFTSEEEAPAYRNTPAKAFVPPASGTLVDSQYFSSTRLPDDDYIAVTEKARTLTRSVATLSPTKASLQAAGMSAQEANDTLANLDVLKAELTGRTSSVSPELEVVPGSGNSAQVSTVVRYSASSRDGSPPVGANASFGFRRSEGKWLLQSITMTVEDTSSYDGPAQSDVEAGITP